MRARGLPDRLPTRGSPLVRATGTALRAGVDQLVRRNLRGVWVRGALPVGGAVWVANHHGWWDYFAAAAALRAAGRTDVGVLMDPANIGNRAIFRAAGAIGTDELRAAAAMAAAGMVLVVFPEGELRTAGPLGPLSRGAAWLAAQAGVPTVPVATRVLLRGQQAAEAYLDVGAAVGPESLQASLADGLAGLDAELAAAGPDAAIPGFVQVVRGVRSWQERFGGRIIRS